MGARSSKDESKDAEIAALKERVAELERDPIQDIVPLANQVLLGSTLGWASGYALNIVGRLAGASVGIGFILLQGLSYMGYVQVDWRKVERDVAKLDRDGDGEVTSNDLKLLARDATDVLAFNLPAGTGFTGGLLYGLNVARPTTAAGIAAMSGLGMRFLLPRAALGGASATGLPALLVAVKKRVDDRE